MSLSLSKCCSILVGFHPVSQTEGLHPTFKIKTKHPDVDFMEFAGMAADIENTMQEIVEEAEANRQLDLRRINDL